MILKINKILTQLGSNIIVNFDEPFRNISKIISYNDNVDGLSNISKISREFSVSYDNKEWSLRYQLTDINLSSYIDISKEFYLKIFYKVIEKFDDKPIIINDFELVYDDKPVVEDKPELPDNGLNLDAINYDVDLAAINEFAENIEQTTNNFINKTSPIEVLYFLHEPDLNTKDVFLNEYSIHNEKARKCIKIILDENSLPKRNIQFDEWGIDFERFVVRVDKIYFEEIFGKNAKPRNNDYLFFEKANRMYYVYSNELVEGANFGAEVYELSLKKYDEDTSIKKTEETEEFLEEKTLSREKLFGEEMQEQMEDMSNPQQNITKFIDSDGVREELHELMNIIDERVINNGVIVMKSYYDLSMIPNDEIAVKYRRNHEILTMGGWSVMAWIKMFENVVDMEFDITNQRRIDSYHIELEISETNQLLKITEDSYIINNDKFFFVSDVIDDHHIRIISRNFLENNDTTGYKKCVPVNILSSVGIDTAFKVDMIPGNIIIRNNNTILKFNNVPNVYDKWVSIFVNISNTHGHVGAYLWEMNQDPHDINSTALISIYNKEYTINEPIVVNKVEPFIVGSNSNYGNLRVFNRTIDKEYHSYIASHINIKKPSTAFIIDDCQVIFNYPKISKGNMGTDMGIGYETDKLQ